MHFHLSWYLSDAVVTSYDQKTENFNDSKSNDYCNVSVPPFDLWMFITKKNQKKADKKVGTFDVFDSLNNFKVGILYGLIVDGFKLGS